MSLDAAGVADKMVALATAIEGRSSESVERSAFAIKKRVAKRVAAATGGDSILSGTTVGKNGKINTRGKKIGVRYRLSKGKAKPSAIVGMTGPADLVENDQARHIVTSRYAKGAGYQRLTKTGRTVKGRSTKESRAASVLFGLGAEGGGRRAVLHWGGIYARYTEAESKGRHPWKDGVKEATGDIPKIHAEVNRAAIKSVFS